jgi:hypothetical protein
MGEFGDFVVKRDFRKDPVTDSEVLYSRWYAVIDDTIGGWSISNVNESVANLNPYEGRFELGSFMTEVEAKHIAYVHNCWLDSVIAMSYIENLGNYFLTYCNHAELTRTH